MYKKLLGQHVSVSERFNVWEVNEIVNTRRERVHCGYNTGVEIEHAWWQNSVHYTSLRREKCECEYKTLWKCYEKDASSDAWIENMVRVEMLLWKAQFGNCSQIPPRATLGSTPNGYITRPHERRLPQPKCVPSDNLHRQRRWCILFPA